MILVCKELEQRLDAVWNRIRNEVIEEYPGISQIECDEMCVRIVEAGASLVTRSQD